MLLTRLRVMGQVLKQKKKLAKKNISGRLKRHIRRKDVLNLSNKNLSEAEVSPLSKSLKFFPTPDDINKAKLKHELDIFGSKLCTK